jgi:hypothetical protein
MYNITSYTVQNEGPVIDCRWTYTTEDGSVSGKHVLATPAGTTPAADLTEEVLVGWLVDQLPNTSEEFDAQIAREKASREAAETLVVHTF